VFDEVHSPHCPLAAQLSLPSVSSYVMRNDFFSFLSLFLSIRYPSLYCKFVKLKVFSIGFKYLQMCATILFRGKPLSLHFLSITLILHYKVLPNISYILYIMLNLKRFSVYLTDNFPGTRFVYALVLYYIEFIICHSK
jgi:hypothetical protein